MTLQEAQERISSSEFTLWKLWIMEEPSRFHRDDYNFAMIAAEVRRVLSKKPNRVKVKDFLPKYETSRQRKRRKEREEDVYFQKLAWTSMLGLNPPEDWLNPPKEEDSEEEENDEEDKENIEGIL